MQSIRLPRAVFGRIRAVRRVASVARSPRRSEASRSLRWGPCVSRVVRVTPILAETRRAKRRFSISQAPFRRSFCTGGADGLPKSDDIKELQTLNARVHRLYSEGLHSEALETAQSVAKRTEQLYGKDHIFYASALNNNALLQKQAGRLGDAAGLYGDAMRVYEAAVGRRHPSFATATHNLALVERLRGNKDEAIRLFSDALDVRRAVHGSEHQDVAVSMHNLGSAVRDTGDLDRAQELQEQALLILRRRLGTEHVVTATCMNALALTLKTSRQFAKALDMYMSALGVQRRALSPRHIDCLQTMHNIAECYSEQGEEEKANDVRAQLLRLIEQPPSSEVGAAGKGNESGAGGDGGGPDVSSV